MVFCFAVWSCGESFNVGKFWVDDSGKKNHKTGGGKRARKKHDEKFGVRMYYVSSLDMWLRNQVFSPNSDPCRHFPL